MSGCLGDVVEPEGSLPWIIHQLFFEDAALGGLLGFDELVETGGGLGVDEGVVEALEFAGDKTLADDCVGSWVVGVEHSLSRIAYEDKLKLNRKDLIFYNSIKDSCYSNLILYWFLK